MPAFDFVLAGRYRLLGPLGEGGMAAVYRARDLRLNREVAVKILREDLTRDPDFLGRFQREAEIVASLSHPSIVPVYDVGEDGGSHFIVMEYIRGRTLKELLEGGPLPPERAAPILGSVLDALAYAHHHGLVHRDVKPHNILMGPDGLARLADFGIARLADGSTTRTAAILGSAQYLSPEQARGDEATPASDIYACGVVLYEMLAGRPPFSGPNALSIAHHHLNTPPPPLPSPASPDATRLLALAHRALAKDPGDRFPDVDVFHNALARSAPDPEATFPLAASNDATTANTRVDAPERQLPPPPATTLVLRRSPRRTIVAGVFWALLLLLAAVAATALPSGHGLPQYPSAPYGVVPAALLAILVMSWIGNRSWQYHMDADAAVVRWGLFSHHRYGLPVRAITTLELKQSLADRLLGLGTVELCARDEHGQERRIVMEDLARPHEAYEELMRLTSSRQR